jgi:UDP-glucose 4-epimerase
VKVLVSGAAGFIAGYLVPELLDRGYEVVGIDNFWKYGPITRAYDDDPRYKFVEGDAKDVELLQTLLADCDHFIAGAAIIGGISLFHELAYDLLAENERLTAAAFDAAIWAHKHHRLRKVTVISSSMVYESATEFPTPEGAQLRCPPPLSTYGFQKLATEFFARGAWEQYKLPYTDCATVQLRGHRGAARDARAPDSVGQHQTGIESRRPRPGAEDSEGAKPPAYPGIR